MKIARNIVFIFVVFATSLSVSAGDKELKKLTERCRKYEESACKELRIKCSKKEKGVGCPYLAIIATSVGEYESALSWLEQGCDYGEKTSCESQREIRPQVEKKSREDELRDLEIERARIELQNAQLQQQNIESENQERNSRFLLQYIQSLNQQPAQPQGKRMRCNTTSAWLGNHPRANQDFRTECSEY